MLPLLWSQMSREQRSRITALAEQTSAGQRPTDDGYQLHQAKQLLALGGWRGSWLAGEVTPDRSGVLRARATYRFDRGGAGRALRLARLGRDARAVPVADLVWRRWPLPRRRASPYGRLVAIGIAALLATQVTINLGMLVGLLPITGLALPLVSYGGSSLLANALALGLLLNVGLRPATN